jgi:hypothetical protein
MLRRLLFAAALVALFCSAMFTANGCGSLPASQPRSSPATTVLRGRVTDAESNAALSGVRVSLQGRLADTDQNGEYAFGSLAAGRSILTAAREGYLVHELPVDLRQDEVNRFDFAMRRR